MSNLSFKVTSEANLAQFQTFLENNNKGDHTRIYGEKKDGAIVLYLKPESKNAVGRLLDRMGGGIANLVGLGDKRRAAAKEGLQTLVNRVAQNVEKENGTLGGVIKLMSDSKVHGFDGYSDLANRKGQMLELTKLIATVVDKAKAPSVPKTLEQRTEESLEKAGLGKDKETPFLEGPKLKVPKEVDPNQPEVGPVKIGDTIYNPTRHIASGGFGHVFEYKSQDEKMTIAFKVSIPDTNLETQSQKMMSLAKEVHLHRQLSEQNPEGVVKMLGAVRLPGGQVGIATEYVPNGDMQKVSGQIHKKIASDENNRELGQITRSEAKVLWLTMLKDMAQGLVSLHKKGVAHLDFKSPNVLIDKFGKGVVADFGTLAPGEKVYLKDTEDIDSAAYKAPEHSYLKSQAKQVKKHIDESVSRLYNEDKKVLEEHLQDLMPSTSEKEIGEFAESIYSDRSNKIREEQRENFTDYSDNRLVFNAPQKVDIWGLGASAIEMFTGTPLLGLKQDGYRFETGKETRLEQFFTTDHEHAIQNRDENDKLGGMSVSDGTGDVKIDRFLNWVLAGKPEERPTAEEILQHPIFSQPGVGSMESYDYIRLLAEGSSPEMMESARANLLDEINK